MSRAIEKSKTDAALAAKRKRLEAELAEVKIEMRERSVKTRATAEILVGRAVLALVQAGEAPTNDGIFGLVIQAASSRNSTAIKLIGDIFGIELREEAFRTEGVDNERQATTFAAGGDCAVTNVGNSSDAVGPAVILVAAGEQSPLPPAPHQIDVATLDEDLISDPDRLSGGVATPRVKFPGFRPPPRRDE